MTKFVESLDFMEMPPVKIEVKSMCIGSMYGVSLIDTMVSGVKTTKLDLHVIFTADLPKL